MFTVGKGIIQKAMKLENKHIGQFILLQQIEMLEAVFPDSKENERESSSLLYIFSKLFIFYSHFIFLWRLGIDRIVSGL